jgi:malic enzyme
MTACRFSTLASDMLEAASNAASSDADMVPYLAMRLALAAALHVLADGVAPELEDAGVAPAHALAVADEAVKERLNADAAACRAQRAATRQTLIALANEYTETVQDKE